MDNRYLKESNHNPFELIDGNSEYAESKIVEAIENFKKFFNINEARIEAKRGYEILIKNTDKKIKVASYKVSFTNSDNVNCSVEVSNPYEFTGQRYWTFFKTSGGFWTNILILKNCDISPEYIFNALAKNRDWIYKKYIISREKLKEGLALSKTELQLAQFDNYEEDVDVYSIGINDDKKDELTMKFLSSIFQK